MKPLICVLLCSYTFMCAAQTKRAIKPVDIYRLQDVSEIKISPDGKWVSYTLSTVDSAKDSRNSDIWMISWDGKENIQLTGTKEDESTADWSPDGKYISFLSSRPVGDEEEDEKELSQIWLMDRRGGEGRKITNVSGEIEEYAWSPDGSRIVFAMKDEDFSDTAEDISRKPFEMDRYHFKEDYIGYLDRRAIHLYILDIASENIDTLTRGDYDETDAAFSPDGKQIAFVSNRTEDPDKNENTDIYIMDAVPGAAMKKTTSWAGADHSPQWSPDGKNIAYLQSTSNEAFTMYGHDMIAVISKNGGEPKLSSQSTDRPIYHFTWNKDGKNIFGLMEDDREGNIVSFDIATSTLTKIAKGERVFYELEQNPKNGGLASLMGTSVMPFEVVAINNGNVNRLTYIQDEFLQPLQLAVTEGFKSKSKDGTIVSGIFFKPNSNTTSVKPPLVLWIHGGPVAQDDYQFDMIPQVLAGAGYAVAVINYRGSSGRGVDYERAIYADWGNKEVMDIQGAADYLVAQALVDGNKIGIGGWSYGGILTDYCIASDTRFKAGCSGAGSAMQLSMYGTDEYITQYETELGVPWKNLDKWMKVSYPFLHADKIKTPTLFMAAQKDFNVPAAGAEQMYQALRSNGVPAQLIIYPNQNHGIDIPSYQQHRYQKYLDWYGKYLK